MCENIDPNTKTSLMYEQLASLRNEVNELKSIIANQNTVMAGELAEMKVFLKEIMTSKRAKDIAQETFPLRNKDELKALEEKISETNTNELIATIKKIVGRGGISKNLHNLLGEEIIRTFNYDGIQHKEAFKTFQRVDDIFYKAVVDDEGCKDNYVKAIKKGFKSEKNKLYKAEHIAKKAH